MIKRWSLDVRIERPSGDSLEREGVMVLSKETGGPRQGTWHVSGNRLRGNWRVGRVIRLRAITCFRFGLSPDIAVLIPLMP
jgi:hypothetical protein